MYFVVKSLQIVRGALFRDSLESQYSELFEDSVLEGQLVAVAAESDRLPNQVSAPINSLADTPPKPRTTL